MVQVQPLHLWLVFQLQVGVNEYGAFSITGAFAAAAPYQRMSLSTTTPVFLVVEAGFSTGTVTACGGIYARRVR